MPFSIVLLFVECLVFHGVYLRNLTMSYQSIVRFLGKRDTNLLCTNAVRKDKGTIYCSTHLIMNGLMEPRKKKAKTGAVIVESTELTSCNSNVWNRSAVIGKSNLTTALSPALVDTYEEMNCMCFILKFGIFKLMTSAGWLKRRRTVVPCDQVSPSHNNCRNDNYADISVSR